MLQQRSSSSKCLARGQASAPRPGVLPLCRSTAAAQANAAPPPAPPVRIVVKEKAMHTLKGTTRQQNEDRAVIEPEVSAGTAKLYLDLVAGVFDGHGGSAVAEWLEKKLAGAVAKNFNPSAPEASIAQSFLAADRALLSVTSGFLGLGERGVGGSKCGATAAVAVLVPTARGSTQLVTGNVGDARITLIKASGEVQQLSVDHVPDDEEERKRIEAQNPNPKMPLVQYKAGTWRVGGLLALSRAFGDAYLKGSLWSEGATASSDGYSSGFGLIAQPFTTCTELGPEYDGATLVVASDGLYTEETRGGGGGLDNTGLSELLLAAGDAPCDKVAEVLASTAVSMGSTDDVTVVVIKLGRLD